jgi:arylsulfatase A-like enzyme
MRIVGVLVVAALAVALPRLHAVAARPNIVWIIVDDMSANFGCYGERLVPTPHVDRLAAEGTRFTHAFVTCPVCSPCRSALITGMYQTSIGAHHHRSGRGVETIHLPAGVRPVPERFREAGYFTCIGDGDEPSRSERPRAGRLGKTDYNFVWDENMYDGSDWSGRAAGQPGRLARPSGPRMSRCRPTCRAIPSCSPIRRPTWTRCGSRMPPWAVSSTVSRVRAFWTTRSSSS